jgi:hypothetical protein
VPAGWARPSSIDLWDVDALLETETLPSEG